MSMSRVGGEMLLAVCTIVSGHIAYVIGLCVCKLWLKRDLATFTFDHQFGYIVCLIEKCRPLNDREVLC